MQQYKPEFQDQSWCHRHNLDIALRHFIRHRSIDTVFGIAKKLFESSIVNSNDGEATLHRNSFRGRFDAGEHRVGTVRIGLISTESSLYTTLNREPGLKPGNPYFCSSSHSRRLPFCVWSFIGLLLISISLYWVIKIKSVSYTHLTLPTKRIV